eukprot:TRINITY_DN11621_c0_g1_i1.p1 TRINITY_DN11621_c0_g1~~TRINITY_DN11621_c0_g1_i1.p1  ORF type:complete len:165 (+),score=44.17 TRINITY_DN11621_c0_g1_i1:652-1146(+)
MLEKSKAACKKYISNAACQQEDDLFTGEESAERFMPQMPARKLKALSLGNKKLRYTSIDPGVNNYYTMKKRVADNCTKTGRENTLEEYDEMEELKEMERKREEVNEKLSQLNTFMDISKQRMRTHNLVNNRYCKLSKEARICDTGNIFNLKTILKSLYNSCSVF